MNEKTQKRLEALLATFDSGAVQPDELIQAIDAVMAVVKSSTEAIAKKVRENDAGTQTKNKTLESDIDRALNQLASFSKKLDSDKASIKDVERVAGNLKTEIERAISLIPELTDEYDDSEMSERMEEQRELIESLQSLVVAENLRNALEALPPGEKLAIEAVEGLREELDKLAKDWRRGGSGGGLGSQIVLDIIAQAVADGTIPTGGGGYTNLTEFVDQTAWRLFYSNGSGDVTELALGADGTFLKSNGTSSAPTFAVPAGSGDVSKVGTPVNNQVGVWTGDGTIEGDASLTFDTTDDTLTVAGKLVTPTVRASSSAGVLLEANGGTDVVLLGAGGGAGATFYGGVNIDGQTRLATSLTGPLRADSGVISVGTDNAGITRSVVVTSGSVTAGNTALTDYVYLVAGAHTISLPAASGNTNLYTIKNNHSANITIDTVGTETIDGTASISIAPEESVNIISNGTNFNIV